jgi:cell shape-determining protein MreC
MARTSSQFGRRRGTLPIKTIIASVFLLLAFGAAVYWREALSNRALDVLAPIGRVRQRLDASDNARLRAELASTTALVADRNFLYKENLELKGRLGRDAGTPGILAGVLMRPPATPYDTLLVDAGTTEGVSAGDFVSAGGTTLIGVVREVYEHSSRVVLFSAPGESYDTMLGGTVPLHMEGQGGGSLVGQVPASTPVAAGDAVVFPGVASAFAGSVSKVISKPGESFQMVYVRLPVDPLSLQFVEIRKHYYAH